MEQTFPSEMIKSLTKSMATAMVLSDPQKTDTALKIAEHVSEYFVEQGLSKDLCIAALQILLEASLEEVVGNVLTAYAGSDKAEDNAAQDVGREAEAPSVR